MAEPHPTEVERQEQERKERRRASYRKWRKKNNAKMAAYMREWRQTHKDKQKAIDLRAYAVKRVKYLDKERERLKLLARRQRAEFKATASDAEKQTRKEEVAKYGRKWYEELGGKERKTAYNHTYARTEKGRLIRRRCEANREARKKNAPGSWTIEEWLEILDKHEHRCLYCGDDFTKANPATIDHATPLSKGGSNYASNLVPACRGCNSSKKGRTLEQYLAWKQKVGKV